MKESKGKKHNIVLGSLPIIGIIIFAGLYVYDVELYPRGSLSNPNELGFDRINDYWCGLMNEKGMNGQQNPAMPFAISAMDILCVGLFSNAFYPICRKICQKPIFENCNPTIRNFNNGFRNIDFYPIP